MSCEKDGGVIPDWVRDLGALADRLRQDGKPRRPDDFHLLLCVPSLIAALEEALRANETQLQEAAAEYAEHITEDRGRIADLEARLARRTEERDAARAEVERLKAETEEDESKMSKAWDYEGYWAAVLGPNRSASDVVREFELTLSRGRRDVDEWLGRAEAEALSIGRLGTSDAEQFSAFHERALEALERAIRCAPTPEAVQNT